MIQCVARSTGILLRSCAASVLVAIGCRAALALDTPVQAFSAVSPVLISLRIHTPGNDESLSQGSAFFVDGEGRAVTAYHVVQDHIERPTERLLRFKTMSGDQGAAKVLAVDIRKDIAVIGTGLKPKAHLSPGDARRAMPSLGETLYAFGDPLALGMSMTTGIYGGPTKGFVTGRLRYSGVLNPGMSGGPAVTASGQLVGVNVSKAYAGESLGFLSGLDGVARLYRESLQAPEKSMEDLRAAIASQIAEHLTGFNEQIEPAWKPQQLGEYSFAVPDNDDWTCSSSAKDIKTESRYDRKGVYCEFTGRLVETSDEPVTRVRLQATYFGSLTQDAVHIASLVRTTLKGMRRQYSLQRVAGQRCQDRLTQAPGNPLPVRLIWCAAPVRKAADQYDFVVSVVTQDDPHRALVVQFAADGVTWHHGMVMTEKLLQSVGKVNRDAIADAR